MPQATMAAVGVAVDTADAATGTVVADLRVVASVTARAVTAVTEVEPRASAPQAIKAVTRTGTVVAADAAVLVAEEDRTAKVVAVAEKTAEAIVSISARSTSKMATAVLLGSIATTRMVAASTRVDRPSVSAVTITTTGVALKGEIAVAVEAETVVAEEVVIAGMTAVARTTGETGVAELVVTEVVADHLMTVRATSTECYPRDWFDLSPQAPSLNGELKMKKV